VDISTLSPEGYGSQLDDISACSSESRATGSSYAEERTVYQQRQPQQPLFHPSATSKRTAKKATEQARDTSYAIAEAALRALHADEFDAFSTTVAAKLRKMSDIQLHIAERIISAVLFRG